ncbi:FUSC family protein [Roseateles terrae]|uniref:Membrane protein YccC n=1 Tax=Roseateles terrae TaxID=431060 RepID=A0ABR6GZ44_9BURK|nr:FUSC family protein [Roseateles terrae]MBB3197335.1 putative membrane protein YccC [Roseateles terrae]OWQ83187.1 fusaric acid resistance protein [Roseateles terrae]
MKLSSPTALLRFSRTEWLFSVKAFAAAMLAVFLANWAGQPRPFWAMMTAYIVAHPLAGAVRSKALYRFVGTLVGSTAAALLVPRFANAPEMLSLALALWVGTCLCLSLRDRTPRAYAFMLAGYTAALIGFPSVDVPLNIFDSAVARVEEIALGILSATLVHSLVLPNGLAGTVLGLLDRTLGDTRGWLSDLTARRDSGADRRRVAGDISQLRVLSTHIPFDTSHLRWTADAVHDMQDRVAALTPQLSAVEDRLRALEQTEGGIAPDVAAMLARVAEWIALPPEEARAQWAVIQEALQQLGRVDTAAAASEPEEQADAGAGADADVTASTDADADARAVKGTVANPGTTWPRLQRVALAERLELLLTGWLQCMHLRADIDHGLSGAPMPSRARPELTGPRLHIDLGMAALSGAAAVVAILVCCTFWVLTGWPMGSAAAMMAAIFCCFFAGMDDPVPAINGFLKWTVLSMPVSALYVLVLLPLVQDIWTLVLVCAPVFLIAGCLVARPTTMGAALPFVLGVSGTLAMHDTSQADLPAFLNSMLGQLAGVFVASRVTRLMRSVGADWSARRIQRATWKELEELARLPRSVSRSQSYLLRMLDRISLLAPRVAQAGGSVPGVPTDDALRDLRLGADLVTLQAQRDQWPVLALKPLLTGLADWWSQRISGVIEPPPAALLGLIDDALRRLVTVCPVHQPWPASARASVSALLGLRRSLFPEAGPGQLVTAIEQPPQDDPSVLAGPPDLHDLSDPSDLPPSRLKEFPA